MSDRRERHVTMGVIMIVFGLLLLGEHLAIVPGLDFSRLWPVVLLAFGVLRMAAPRHAVPDPLTGRIPLVTRLGAGFWFLFVGGLFLLNNYDVLTIEQSWPLFIVAGGVSILLGRHAHDAAPPPAGVAGQ